MDDKARIIAETLEPNAVISEVARRHGLRPQQVFTWRRNARTLAASATQDGPAFVPAVVSAAEPAAKRPTRPWTQEATPAAGAIELEIDGIAMRVGRGADAATIAAVIRAVRATT
jgi:transposase